MLLIKKLFNINGIGVAYNIDDRTGRFDKYQIVNK